VSRKRLPSSPSLAVALGATGVVEMLSHLPYIGAMLVALSKSLR
jgi:hypothetical protein